MNAIFLFYFKTLCLSYRERSSRTSWILWFISTLKNIKFSLNLIDWLIFIFVCILIHTYINSSFPIQRTWPKLRIDFKTATLLDLYFWKDFENHSNLSLFFIWKYWIRTRTLNILSWPSEWCLSGNSRPPRSDWMLQFQNEFMKSSFLPKYEPEFLPCTVPHYRAEILTMFVHILGETMTSPVNSWPIESILQISMYPQIRGDATFYRNNLSHTNATFQLT